MFERLETFKTVQDIVIERNPVIGKWEVSVSGVDYDGNSNLETFFFNTEKECKFLKETIEEHTN